MGTNWWALLGSGIHDAARRKEKKTHVNICHDCGKQYAKTIKWPQTCPRCGSNSKDTVSKAMVAHEANKKKEEKRNKPALPYGFRGPSSVAICKNCRNTIKSDAKFCGKCGLPWVES